MTHTQLLLRDEAREKLLRGATALAEAVRVTLGPRSKSVLIEKKYGSPIVCDDGVTIAKEFSLKDHEENLGARMLREAATQTGERVGDGTTTATILAHALFAEGLRNIVAGASAIELKRGIERGARVVVAELARLSRPTRTRAERAQVATVSAHDDRAIGERVAEAMERVGGDGVVSLEEAKGTETTLEGDVDRWQQREDAVRCVERLTGVRGVTNRIEVKAEAVDPTKIRKSIESALKRRAEREAGRIAVTVSDGVVTLKGTVDSWADRNALERLASHSPGVKDLINEIRVDPFA